MEFNCASKNEGNNGGIIMYNYRLDHIEPRGQFFVLIDCALMCEGKSSSYDRHTVDFSEQHREPFS